VVSTNIPPQYTDRTLTPPLGIGARTRRCSDQHGGYLDGVSGRAIVSGHPIAFLGVWVVELCALDGSGKGLGYWLEGHCTMTGYVSGNLSTDTVNDILNAAGLNAALTFVWVPYHPSQHIRPSASTPTQQTTQQIRWGKTAMPTLRSHSNRWRTQWPSNIYRGCQSIDAKCDVHVQARPAEKHSYDAPAQAPNLNTRSPQPLSQVADSPNPEVSLKHQI
jgi:hypothetical protein